MIVGGENMSIHIIVDSCCDLPLEFVEAHQELMTIIGMPVSINDVDYLDDLGKTLTHDMLYSSLREGIMPTTAQINGYRFTELFKEKAKCHETIIYVGFSSGMSGTYENALNCIETVRETIPNVDIRVIDSRAASVGQGLLVMKVLDMVKEKAHPDQIVDWVEAYKLKANHWFAVDDLHHLKKGGRVSAAEATIGTLLSVKPIIIVNHKGQLKPFSKVKGRKKSIKYLVQKFEEHYDKDVYDKVMIGHGNVAEDAKYLKKALLKYVNEDQIIISELSATIATHVGPGMLGMAFMGGIREDK